MPSVSGGASRFTVAREMRVILARTFLQPSVRASNDFFRKKSRGTLTPSSSHWWALARSTGSGAVRFRFLAESVTTTAESKESDPESGRKERSPSTSR